MASETRKSKRYDVFTNSNIGENEKHLKEQLENSMGQSFGCTVGDAGDRLYMKAMAEQGIFLLILL
jgi:hypothetical protein